MIIIFSEIDIATVEQEAVLQDARRCGGSAADGGGRTATAAESTDGAVHGTRAHDG